MTQQILSEEERASLDRLMEEIHVVIPTNSPSLLIEETTSRFNSAIWYEEIKKKTITLAGLGGIGSYVAFLLARMLPARIFMYDPDIVETVNMSGQLYGLEDIGESKVNAIANMITKYSDCNDIFTLEEEYTKETGTSDIMICGFDNMKARETFFHNWRGHVYKKSAEEKKNCLFIDGRLSAEYFQVLCIRGDDNYNINRYAKEFLFKDEEAEETICSYKQTSFCANMIASIIVNLFVNFCANSIEEKYKPIMERDLPFFTSYNAETMYFKTER